jgi:glycosyltransferase 2 family protein
LEALKQAGRKLPLTSLATLGLLFVDQAVPSMGLSGTILLLRGLARRDIPANMTMSAILADMVSYYGAYSTVVVFGVGLLWMNHQANAAVLAGATIFATVVVAIPVILLWLRHLGRVSLPTWTKRFPKVASLLRAMVAAPSAPLRSLSLMTKVTLLQLSIFILDSLTLWLSFQAFGRAPAFWNCFVAFVVASAATIGPIPLGLGTFEAACIAILHAFGVSLGRGPCRHASVTIPDPLAADGSGDAAHAARVLIRFARRSASVSGTRVASRRWPLRRDDEFTKNPPL